MQAGNKLTENAGNKAPEKSGPQKETGPKDHKYKFLTTEAEDTDIVNGQSQNQVTNAGDELTGTSEATDDRELTEEEQDEELNNARDALNNDNYPLPPDERDDTDLN
jgi:hypothetical protein